MLFPALSLFGLPAGPSAVLDLTADFAPLLVGLWVLLGLCVLGLGVALATHDTWQERRQDKKPKTVRLPRLICPMQRNSNIFRVHRQVFPSLAVSRGSQVSPPSCGPPAPSKGS
jgi:hypothetical protein